MQASLGRLPAAQCEAFVLRVVEEYTDEEAAALLAIPVGTLKRRLRPDDLARALARLYVATGRCDTALTRLHQLQARGALGDDAVLLGRCESTSD